MIVLGLILLVSSGALTSPVPLNPTLSSETSADQFPGASNNPPDPRNPYSIAFTCIITTFLCAWTSVHPNIPPTDISWWTRKKLRIELLFWTIIAPELILTWALSQWMGARRLAREHKADGWTLTHGFLLMMGGFCYVRKDRTCQILNYDHARDTQGEIFPSDTNHIIFKDMNQSQIQQITKMVSEKEIQDKSKSDFLSKSITALQTTWFIVQCIARRVQGLSITELELTTIAIAMLNVFMMFFWWNKPMDVEVPILLHVGSSCPWTSSQLSINLQTQATEKANSERWWQFKFSPFEFVDGLLDFFYIPAMQIIFQDFNLPQSDNRFTTIELSTKEQWARSVCLVLIASTFGGLHLVAWTFEFPSQGAWICWQTAALVITTAPCALIFILMLLGALLALWEKVGLDRPRGEVLGHALMSISVVIVPISYIAARLTLLVEALVLLAYIPPDGLIQIDWLRFIPHL